VRLRRTPGDPTSRGLLTNEDLSSISSTEARQRRIRPNNSPFERQCTLADLPTWLGDVPTWITTLAIAFAGFQLLSERQRRLAEQDRASKAQARKISAWAASDRHAEPKAFGVVVSNRSDSTFHDVTVSALIYHKEQPPIRFTVLPPGDYFVELLKEKGEEKWEYAVHVDEYGGHLRPYTGTAGYQVTEIIFTDNLNQRWSADHHMVLQRDNDSEADGAARSGSSSAVSSEKDLVRT